MRRKIPRVMFSTSKVIGHGGSYDGKTIMVATDFPLWFVTNVIVHEFGHWIIDWLPLQFRLRYDVTMWMENFAVRMIRILPQKDRDKDVYWKTFFRRAEKLI